MYHNYACACVYWFVRMYALCEWHYCVYVIIYIIYACGHACIYIKCACAKCACANIHILYVHSCIHIMCARVHACKLYVHVCK